VAVAVHELLPRVRSLLALLLHVVRRGHDVVIPRGATVLERGDRLTIIGEPAGLHILGEHLSEQSQVAP
ncbi:MAG TPA: hypothetical protein EYQ64_05590, partial [Gemmatimonadetes bacterium]|nr:hypothetical protein [Gemmatimonadota bacterium]